MVELERLRWEKVRDQSVVKMEVVDRDRESECEMVRQVELENQPEIERMRLKVLSEF